MNYYEKTRCIVLNAAKSREVDKILLLCTYKFGKIQALAPGALKIDARLSSSLEPLRDVEITLWVPAVKRNDPSIGIKSPSIRIVNASISEDFEVFIKDKNKLLNAFECARIYNAIIPYMEPDEGKSYTLLRRAFELFASCPVDFPSVIRLITISYALRILRLAGYDFGKMVNQTTQSSDTKLINSVSTLLLRTDGDTLLRNALLRGCEQKNNGWNFSRDSSFIERLFSFIKNYIDEIAEGKV